MVWPHMTAVVTWVDFGLLLVTALALGGSIEQAFGLPDPPTASYEERHCHTLRVGMCLNDVCDWPGLCWGCCVGLPCLASVATMPLHRAPAMLHRMGLSTLLLQAYNLAYTVPCLPCLHYCTGYYCGPLPSPTFLLPVPPTVVDSACPEGVQPLIHRYGGSSSPACGAQYLHWSGGILRWPHYPREAREAQRSDPPPCSLFASGASFHSRR
mmetsp:Transcript_81496/g.162110  ORF Transcript_81496/g.162110 Transcript_81496/m.162110 type:complete len:211 (+) Transcript_81496:123-755(+)